MKILIGTRASHLAMTQTRTIVQKLGQQWPNLEIEIKQIHTKGDRITGVPLAQMGSDGIFVNEIEHALQEREIDLAVHSLKDLPTVQPEDLRLIIVGPREDTRDVFISQRAFTVSQEGLGAQDDEVAGSLRIGTCSLRRIAQIRHLYPEAEILPVRGNVDTRVRKVEAGEYDGIILAAAGLHRLQLHERLADRLTYFPTETLLPAPGQGALALEYRNESAMQELLEPLRDVTVQAATTAERMFMRCLGAGCYLPVAAAAEVIDGYLRIQGLVASLDGKQRILLQDQIVWKEGTALACAEELGVRLAEQALEKGAGEIIRELIPVREQEKVHV